VTPATESDELEEPSDNERRPSSPPATQYELLRDDGFRHLQNEDEDDQRMTQKLHGRPKLIGDNHAAENGIIESITCINFMCHERLQCDLGPLLNFIVGENGSGKSAILTAITLCLGGKPSSTNRGGSLKSFIKEGRDQCILTVKIKNQGPDAYHREIYGDSIIVERHFSRTGSSGFKVKPALGNRIISTKRQEVEEIVEYYCLQVDNPLNVLSQDNARQFLNAATPQAKYKFFIQGVQLEQLDNDYRVVQETAELMETRNYDYDEVLQAKQKDCDEKKKRLDIVKNNEELRRKARLYSNQSAWAQVADEERDLAEKTATVAKLVQEIADAESVIETTSAELEQENERLQRAQAEEQAVLAAVDDANGPVEAAKEAYQLAKTQLESLHAEEREAHAQVGRAKKRIAGLESQIKAEERLIEEANGGAQTKLRRELEGAEQAVADLEAEVGERKKEADGLVKALDQAKRDIMKSKDAIDALRPEIRSVEDDIATLQRGTGSPNDAYEATMPRLLTEIEREADSFEMKPVGPIGSHVRLLEPRWSGILEKTMGRTLSGFIVTSKRDQSRLQAMMNRFKVFNSPILIAMKQPLDLHGKEPDASFLTILRVLKIEDQLIRDQLIINHGIEQILLIPDREEGEKTMFDGPPPRNVQACLCFHDTRPGFGLRLTARGGSLTTSTTEPEKSQRPRMKADLDSRIHARREALHGLEQEMRKLEGEKRILDQQIRRAETDVAMAHNVVKLASKKHRAAEVVVERIKDGIDGFTGAEGKLTSFKEELQAARQEEEHHGRQYGEMALRKTAKNEEVEALRKALKTEQAKAKDIESKVTKAHRKVERCQATRSIALGAKNEAHEKTDMLRNDKMRAEIKRDKQQETVVEFTAEARKIASDRVYLPEGETYSMVAAKLQEVSRQLKEREKSAGMTDAQINEEFIAARKDLDMSIAQARTMKAVLRALKMTLAQRLAKWRQFQRHISAASRVNFIYLLSERGFRGGLIIDHEKHMLTLRVEPDETRKGASGRNTKTLSGGEKSFSSICLLLAIWEAMGSPLRCLDEFDVFMDNVNRAISTNMLITAARRSVGRQYILITPNAIEGSSHREKDVHIIR
jgi:structural maintenance of chromosomes protein 6